uniref:Anoctamin n=1 Tax=Clastoptera arizonana TaxID=38151 RepID=A0A1B6EGA3_9HEMI
MDKSEIRKRVLEDKKKHHNYIPPTYFIIQFSNKIKAETIEWLTNKIKTDREQGGAELQVRKQPILETQKHNVTIHISADSERLLELAQELDVKKIDKISHPYEFTYHDFIPSEDKLTTAEKQVLVRHELENIRALLHETYIPGYPDKHLYEGQSILSAYLYHGLVKQVFPLHDMTALLKLRSVWHFSLFNKQPYEEIRSYFGESVTLYFQFLGFYTAFLTLPMMLGFFQWFVAPDSVAFFCIINIIGAAIFLEVWQRKCTELAFIWGTISMASSLDDPRPNFIGVMGKDVVTERLQPQSPRWKTNVKMYCVSFPLVFLCMIGGFIVMLASFWIEDLLKSYPDLPWFIYYVPSSVYAGMIYVMNMFYRQLANFLTEWENHRTQSQFDRHRVTKLVPFEFVNNFMSLFYIAFIYQDMDMLKYQLATLLIILQFINNIQEAVLPVVIQYYKKKKADAIRESPPLLSECLLDVEELDPHDPQVIQAEEECRMEPYEDPYDDYLELFVQFGYVFLFSSISPMAAFWAVLNNIFEIWTDSFKLCYLHQRPMARRVKDTGAWQRAFQTLCTISIMTNCALFALSPALKSMAPAMSPVEWVLLFVGIEHLLLFIKQILHFAIPDKPDWVRIALAKIGYQSTKALKKQRLENRRLRKISEFLPNKESLKID